METREQIYNAISEALTDYEDALFRCPLGLEYSEYMEYADNFYSLLVDIQNAWEPIITADRG